MLPNFELRMLRYEETRIVGGTSEHPVGVAERKEKLQYRVKEESTYYGNGTHKQVTWSDWQDVPIAEAEQ